MRFSLVIAIAVAAVLLLVTGTCTAAPGKDKGKGPEMGHQEQAKGTWVPPGLSKDEQDQWKDGTPPGWSRGEKEGWHGAHTPPGWEKWTDEERDGWQKQLGEAKKQLRNEAKKTKSFSNRDLNSALISMEVAAVRGVPIRNASEAMERAMKKGLKARELETAAKAMAYGVGKEVDFDQLGEFVANRLNEGLRGDQLATEIYKEIARRHEERSNAQPD